MPMQFAMVCAAYSLWPQLLRVSKAKQNFDANKINGNNLDLVSSLLICAAFACVGACVWAWHGACVRLRRLPNNRNEVCKVFDTCEKDVEAGKKRK